MACDGTSAAARITAADPEIIARIEADGVVPVPPDPVDTAVNHGAWQMPRQLLAHVWFAEENSCPKPVRCGHVAAVRRSCKSRLGGRSEPTCPRCAGPSTVTVFVERAT